MGGVALRYGGAPPAGSDCRFSIKVAADLRAAEGFHIMPNENNIFKSIVLIQDGKIVDVPVADNYQVHPAAGSVIVGDPQPILKALKARFPKCAFIWFADPVTPAGNPSDPSAGDGRSDQSNVPHTAEPPSVVEPPAATESQPDLANPPPPAPDPSDLADQSLPGKKRKSK